MRGEEAKAWHLMQVGVGLRVKLYVFTLPELVGGKIARVSNKEGGNET